MEFGELSLKVIVIFFNFAPCNYSYNYIFEKVMELQAVTLHVCSQVN